MEIGAIEDPEADQGPDEVCDEHVEVGEQNKDVQGPNDLVGLITYQFCVDFPIEAILLV